MVSAPATLCRSGPGDMRRRAMGTGPSPPGSVRRPSHQRTEGHNDRIYGQSLGSARGRPWSKADSSMVAAEASFALINANGYGDPYYPGKQGAQVGRLS